MSSPRRRTCNAWRRAQDALAPPFCGNCLRQGVKNSWEKKSAAGKGGAFAIQFSPTALPEKSGQNSAGFLTRRESFSQIILRLFQRGFLGFTVLTKLGQLCLYFIVRGLLFDGLLECFAFRIGSAGSVPVTLSPTATATIAATAKSAETGAHARVPLRVHHFAHQWLHLFPIFLAFDADRLLIAVYHLLTALCSSGVVLSGQVVREKTNRGCGGSQDQ